MVQQQAHDCSWQSTSARLVLLVLCELKLLSRMGCAGIAGQPRESGDTSVGQLMASCWSCTTGKSCLGLWTVVATPAEWCLLGRKDRTSANHQRLCGKYELATDGGGAQFPSMFASFLTMRIEQTIQSAIDSWLLRASELGSSLRRRQWAPPSRKSSSPPPRGSTAKTRSTCCRGCRTGVLLASGVHAGTVQSTRLSSIGTMDYLEER